MTAFSTTTTKAKNFGRGPNLYRCCPPLLAMKAKIFDEESELIPPTN